MRIVWMSWVLGVAVAQNPQYNIISYLNEPNINGSYRYSYETDNGISVQEDGYLKNQGQEGLEAQTVKGSYSYTAPDGQVYKVTWYADETGFHAEGAHLPTLQPPSVIQPGGFPGAGGAGGAYGGGSLIDARVAYPSVIQQPGTPGSPGFPGQPSGGSLLGIAFPRG